MTSTMEFRQEGREALVEARVNYACGSMHAGVTSQGGKCPSYGHAVCALQKCDTVADLKAVSQNLMHESLVTRDSIYSVLQGASVGQRIAQLGEDADPCPAADDRVSALAEQVRALQARLDEKHLGP